MKFCGPKQTTEVFLHTGVVAVTDGVVVIDNPTDAQILELERIGFSSFTEHVGSKIVPTDPIPTGKPDAD